MGATLTTTRQQGNLLIIHQCYSTSEPRNALHHQPQIILRNSASPEYGLVSLLMLSCAWRKIRGHHHAQKLRSSPHIFPVVLVAIGCTSAFTVAGGFSSRISSAPGNEVLLKGDQCSISTIQNPSNVSINTKPISANGERINNAANYAQQCYTSNSSGVLDCDKFVVENLILPSSTIKNDSSCPFESSICRSNVSNIILDTGYIDSNDHLGLNAPASQRYAWRYVLQCAPLLTERYTNKVTIDNKTMVSYSYGDALAGAPPTCNNFTYEIPDLDQQYFNIPGVRSGINYKLRQAYYCIYF